MPDSTHPHRPSSLLRLPVWLLAIGAALVLAGAGLTGTARADGDPASDVLAAQSSYLPTDVGIPLAEQGQIISLLRSATAAGLHLRVAVIASPTDLGSIGELWRQPQSYARFLGQELTFVYGGRLLVVMPNGYGIYPQSADAGAAVQTALAGAKPPTSGLGPATLDAIRRIAGAQGIHLTIPSATAASPASSGIDLTAVIVFALGVVVILAAWGISLRVRPWRMRGHAGGA
jgi:hypothetical protein